MILLHPSILSRRFLILLKDFKISWTWGLPQRFTYSYFTRSALTLNIFPLEMRTSRYDVSLLRAIFQSKATVESKHDTCILRMNITIISIIQLRISFFSWKICNSEISFIFFSANLSSQNLFRILQILDYSYLINLFY